MHFGTSRNIWTLVPLILACKFQPKAKKNPLNKTKSSHYTVAKRPLELRGTKNGKTMQNRNTLPLKEIQTKATKLFVLWTFVD